MAKYDPIVDAVKSVKKKFGERDTTNVNNLEFLDQLSQKDRMANQGFDVPVEYSPTVKGADIEQQKIIRSKAAAEGYAIIGDQPALPGAPSTPNVTDLGPAYVGQNSDIKNSAIEYTSNASIPYSEPEVYKKNDEIFSEAVAEEFDYMKQNPNSPRVKKAYDALIKETEAQYEQMLKDGVTPFFIRGENPYAGSPYAALRDISENKRIGIFPTKDGYGSGNETWDVMDPKNNPLVGESKYDLAGEPLLFNDMFRAVHDYFGHAKSGVGFRAAGEEMAYQSHSGMFSPLAMRAVAVETRGQNSWLNYGPQGDINRTAKFAETTFAQQKTGLLPNWSVVENTPLGDQRLSYIQRAGNDGVLGRLAGAVDDDGIVTLSHMSGSRQSLDRIDPEYYGRGLSGRTVSERNLAASDGFAKRWYGGVNTKENPYAGEVGLGPNPHSVDIRVEQIYDIASDPDNLFSKIAEKTIYGGRRSRQERYNELSNLIDENGYSAMLQSTPQGNVVAVFDVMKTKSKQKGYADMKLLYAIPAAALGFTEVVMNNKQHIVEAMAVAGGFASFSSDSEASAGSLGKTVINAWHGSPHSFDKFDSNYIGSGEGAQAYGYGSYFGGKKETGESYRESLSNETHLNGFNVGGVVYDRGTPQFKAISELRENGEQGALELLESYQADLKSGDAYIIDMGGQEYIDAYVKTINDLKDVDPANIEPQVGNLYNVEIDAEPDQMLDWDLPLDEQSDFVKERLSEAGIDLGTKEGRKLYYTIKPNATNPKEASDALKALGIQGIQFADGASRNLPIKMIAKRWREVLPDDAGFDEVRELIDNGHFSTKQTELLEALEADDYLGFDYPAGAIEAAFGGNISDWDPSPRLTKAIRDSRSLGSKNYVVFDDKLITIKSKNGKIIGGTSAVAAAAIASEESYAKDIDANMSQDFADREQAAYERATGTFESVDPQVEWDNQLAEMEQFDVDMMLASGAPGAIGIPIDAITALPGIAAQAVGGLAEAVQNIDKTLNSFTDFTQNLMPEMNEGMPNDEYYAGMELLMDGDITREQFDIFSETGELPEGVDISQESTPATVARVLESAMGQPEGVAESVTKMGVQFFVPFTQFQKALKGIGWTAEKGLSAAGRTLTAEALVANAAFDPFEDQFGKLLQDLGVESEFLDWITTKDSEAEARLKTTLDVVGVAAGFEGVTAAAGSETSKKLFKAMLNNKVSKAALASIGTFYAARKGFKEQTAQEVAEEAVDIQKQRFDAFKTSAGDPDAPAYNMGAGSIDEVEINFARINTDDDVKELIQNLADEDISEINAARRGKVGWDQTSLEADKLDAFQVLADRRVGEPLNAAQTVAVRNLWAQSGKRSMDLANEVALNPSPLNMIAYKRQLVIHSAIQREVLGARAETARALNAWRMPADDKQLTTLVDELSNETNIQEIAKRHVALSEAGSAEQVEAFVNGTAWAKTRDAVAQAWYFALLSGPKTHARNFFGNALTTMLRPAELSLAARMPGMDTVKKGEAAASLYGMTMGMIRGLRVSKETGQMGTVWQAVKNNKSGFGVGKVDQPMITGLDPQRWNLEPGTIKYNLAAFVNGTLSIPGRALTASDELFTTMNFDMEIHRLAFKKVDEMIEKGEISEPMRQQQMDELLNNPEEYMILTSQAQGKRQVFTDIPEKTEFNVAWNSISQLPVLGKIVQPFRNTPYNIGLYTFERTPLAPVVKRYRDAINAGGEAKEMAIAQQTMGTAIMLVGADLTMSGHLTGNGPADADDRREWLLTHKPYSVRWEDPNTGEFKHVSYRGMEPIGGLLSMMATVTEILQATEGEEPTAEIKELMVATSAAVASSMSVQSYMSGVSDFFEMMNDPTVKADRYFNRIAATLAVPSAVNEYAKSQDPVMRHAQTMTDMIKARTPGLSNQLPARYDRWGNERTRRSDMGKVYDAVSPFYKSSIKPQPIDTELSRLRKVVKLPGGNQSFSKPYGGGSIEVKLRKDYPAAYYRMVQLAGNEITKTQNGAPITANGFVSQGGTLQEELNLLVTGQHQSSGMYNMFTDGEDGGKAAFIQSILNQYRLAAKAQVLIEYPDLQREVNSRSNTPKYKFQETN
jgi:hypothetical protein